MKKALDTNLLPEKQKKFPLIKKMLKINQDYDKGEQG